MDDKTIGLFGKRSSLPGWKVIEGSDFLGEVFFCCSQGREYEKVFIVIIGRFIFNGGM
jgi:hypothetical protein